jgi:uncharacterized DUF497 family protein
MDRPARNGVHRTRNRLVLVDFEWDPKKAEQNRRKHGVEFLDAVMVLDDDRAIELEDEHSREELY